MNAPIPDPMIAPREVQRGPRPEAMKLFMIGALLFTLAGIAYCDGTLTEVSVTTDIAVYLILSVIWLALLWQLWLGRNWARLTVMFWCVVAVFSVLLMSDYNLLQQLITIADAVFSAILFWWLRTPAAVEFTKGQPA